MNIEIVMQILADGRIRTNRGLRLAQGRMPVNAGDAVTVLGGVVMGWTRRAGVVPGPMTPATLYRLADYINLIMYTVDSDFNVITETAITPPAGGDLLLHCSNGRTEYLVWFFNSPRCLIQKNGETLADFTSVFPAAPYDAEAYIDDNGDLVWGAVNNGGGACTIAVYKNETLTGVGGVESTNEVAIQYGERLNQRAAAVEYDVQVTVDDQTTRTYSTLSIRGNWNGVVYHAEYNGCLVSSDGWCNVQSSLGVFGCLHALGYIPTHTQSTVFISPNVAAEQADGNGNMVDVSYIDTTAVTYLYNATVFRTDDQSIVAEKQEQDAITSGSFSNNTYSTTATAEFDTEESFVWGTVSTWYTTPNTTTNFVMILPGITVQQDLGFINEPVVITGHHGTNDDVSRIGYASRISIDGSTYYYHFRFAEAWPEIPANGHSFTFLARAGTVTVNETTCTLDITTSLPAIDTPCTDPIVTDIGNGYAIEKQPKIEAWSWVSTESELTLDGVKIFDAVGSFTMAGAWHTEQGKLRGVVSWTALSAIGDDVQEITPTFEPGNIITKRF